MYLFPRKDGREGEGGVYDGFESEKDASRNIVETSFHSRAQTKRWQSAKRSGRREKSNGEKG